jgi:hypothetical protein
MPPEAPEQHPAATPPAEPSPAELAAALARLMAAADRCMAAFYRSARW